jgi:arabinofuranosyltransferase
VPRTTPDRRSLTVIFLSTLFLVVLIRTAWLGDDAYITLRTVDNFVSGLGMRWNVAERVQSFTHPLWFFLLSIPYWVTREGYFTVYALVLSVSLAAYVTLLRGVASSVTTAWLAGSTLLFSKSFMDFSTSGLENPLSHLLILLFLMAVWRARDGLGSLTAVWLCAALLMLNRLDLIVLLAPPLLATSWPFGWRRSVRAATIGLAPLVAWELFSLIYYGFPFPNTAYAKLQTGVVASTLLGQGLLYVLETFSADPVTPLIAVSAAAMTLWHRPRRDWPMLLGCLLYIGYIVRVGGDFMIGRFLTVPLLTVVAVWARTPWRLRATDASGALAAVALLGLFATTRPPITSGADTFILDPAQGMSSSGIADERAFYYRVTGLLRWSRERPLPWNTQVAQGAALRQSPRIVNNVNVGFLGYFAGPAVTIIDEHGLCDPLLARMPAEGNWRIGHFHRTPPPGYIESLENNRNMIADPSLRHLYEQIRRVTRDPIWSTRRWHAIVELNSPF